MLKKRGICFLLFFTLCIGLQSGIIAGAEESRTMYAADGRELSVPVSEVEAYKAVGWFTAPPVWMYAADGRSLLVSKDETALYQTLGWFLERPVLLYAEDGRTLYVAEEEVEAYLNVGWYLEPMQTVYAPGNRRILVPAGEVQAYVDVGWFTTYDEALYNEVIAAVQQARSVGDYNLAMDLCDDALQNFQQKDSVFYADISAHKIAVMDAWRASVKQPIVTLNTRVSDSYGSKYAYLTLRNISHKTITALELDFYCYNAFYEPVRYLGVGSNLFEAYALQQSLQSSETEVWSWYLFGFEDVDSVRNIYVKRVKFADGTIWER